MNFSRISHAAVKVMKLNFDIHLLAKSCARHNAKPFNFYIFRFHSFFWIFGYITHGDRYFITWVTNVYIWFQYLSIYFSKHPDVEYICRDSHASSFVSLPLFTILFERIWFRNELIIFKHSNFHVMWCKVAHPKFPTVYNASSSLLELLSHLPPPQMHLLTWFFLLWPLATIYYHLGVLNSLLPHWESYKSPDTAIFSTTVLNTQCKPISLIIHIISIGF